MASYLKDKKIEIWRTDYDARNENGFLIEKTMKIADAWAYYRHISAKEYYAAMAVQEEYQAIFVINYRPGLDPRSDYIIYRGQRYDIVSIDDFEGGKRDIKITAKSRR